MRRRVVPQVTYGNIDMFDHLQEKASIWVGLIDAPATPLEVAERCERRQEMATLKKAPRATTSQKPRSQLVRYSHKLS